MTIRHLKLFLEVYQTMNITKAAESLHMTQPTVTRAIQELEAHYGTKLFDRLNHRLYATESGQSLFLHASKVLGAFDDMDEKMRNLHNEGTLHIGAALSIGSIYLPAILAEFKRRYPRYTLKSTVSNAEVLLHAMAQNEVDFSLIDGGMVSEDFQMEPYSSEQLVLILPPQHPLRRKHHLMLDDLKEEPFLLREKGSTIRNFVDQTFENLGLPLNPIMESASTHALVQAVHAGIGIAILPRNLVWHSIETGFVATNVIDDVSLSRRSYIVWHKGKYLSEVAKELMQICRENRFG